MCAVVAAGGLAGGFAALGANVAAAHSSSRIGAAAVAGSPQSATHGLDVLPFPGTPDAPPGTPVDFPAVAPAQMLAVRAVGSRTGLHPGRLSAQPQNAGTQFAPRRPFAPGERVSVTAVLRSAAAGAASGAPGSRKLRFSFTIARPAHVRSYSSPFAPGAGGTAASPDTLGMSAGAMRTNGSSRPTHSFVTQPDFHPPTISMVGKDTDHASGNIFLTSQNTGQNGPYFLNSNGDLRWYHPTSGPGHGKGPAAFDFRVQYYEKHPYLTYWEGHLNFPPGDGTGDGVMLGVHYRRVHTVTAGAGYQSNGVDLHEFSIGANGNAFVTVYAPVHTNLTSVGGPSNGVVFDCIAQEINIKTNRVLWEWNALDHVPVYDTYAHYSGGPFDYFHMNSIQQLPNGHVIISSRHMWAVYSIDMKTGKIDWTLGGRHSYFWMGSGTHFYWQHDATLHAGGLMTIFDDGAGDGGLNENQSRALAIHLNIQSRHATLDQAYLHNPPVLTTSMGSTQVVQDHNVFVGWGGAPSFSEYTQGGDEIFKGDFQRPVSSYRAYRSGGFIGRPVSAPVIAVRKASKGGGDNIYASWNGSSLVTKWRVRAGSSKSKLSSVKVVSWAGFETTIKVSKAKYFQVVALDGKGHALPHGTSRVVAGR